ncbi:MAG: CinA family protein [Hyphomicrobiaceae bacterium]
MFDEELRAEAVRLLDDARAAGLRFATAESCTGGLIAGLLTEIAGSSDVFERGFVTYSNDAKAEILGVPRTILRTEGAVSRATAEAMAAGTLAASRADAVVAVTGIAGPGGGGPGKPVGLVHLAALRRGGSVHHEERRFGDAGRSEVRRLTVVAALELLRAVAFAATEGGRT